MLLVSVEVIHGCNVWKISWLSCVFVLLERCVAFKEPSDYVPLHKQENVSLRLFY